jgi:hypothetical protein
VGASLLAIALDQTLQMCDWTGTVASKLPPTVTGRMMKDSWLLEFGAAFSKTLWPL